MHVQAYVRKFEPTLLDAMVPKYHEKRRLVAQRLESEFFETPKGLKLRLSVNCTDKANELRVESETNSLLWICHFSLTCEIRLLLPTSEELTIVFSELDL